MSLLFKSNLFLSLVLLLIPLFSDQVFVGYVVTMVILVLLVLKDEQALRFLFVYFPLRPFLIELNPGLKYLGDLVILLLLLKTCLKFASGRSTLFVERTFKDYQFFLGLLIFALIGSLAALLSGVSLMALVFQLRAYFIMLVLLFIAMEMKATQQLIYSLLNITVFMAVILSLQGLVEKLSFRTYFLPRAWQELDLAATNAIRIYGLVGNPNVLAIYLIIAFVSGLYLIKVFPRFKLVYLAALILIFGVFLLTYSRGTMIAFGLAAGLFIFLRQSWRTALNMLGIALVAVVLIYYPTVLATDYLEESFASNNQEDFKKRYGEMFSDTTLGESSGWGRLYVIKMGWKMFRDHPLIGTGFATFGDSASLAYGSPFYETENLPGQLYTDNQYIQILVQTGLIGTLALLYFLIKIVTRLHETCSNRKIRSFFYTSIVFVAILSLFYNTLEDKILTLYLFTFIGLLLNKDFLASFLVEKGKS